jgi:hypothetical protein
MSFACGILFATAQNPQCLQKRTARCDDSPQQICGDVTQRPDMKRIGDGEGPDDAPLEAREDDDLPVVARLVVEIRSDGRRTIARGAVEDRASGQKVAIEARGDSPAQLAMALARSLWKMPGLGARRAVRGLLGRGRPKR